jgi:hypothetical protein
MRQMRADFALPRLFIRVALVVKFVVPVFMIALLFPPSPMTKNTKNEENKKF